MATKVLIIPTSLTLPFYTQRVRLDGREYSLRFRWNTCAERWRMDLLTDENEPIVLGMKIVTDWPLLRYYKFDPRCPPGEFFAQTLTQDTSPPGFSDLGIGQRVELTYYAATEA